MESQENQQIDPECLIEVTEEDDPYTREPIFVVKIVINKQIKNKMLEIEKSKRDRLYKLQQKEKSPEYISSKQKLQAYRKLDSKSLQQQRRKNAGNNEFTQCLAKQDAVKITKQKLGFPIFESFQNRGKSPYLKFSYSAGSRYIYIKINKHYFLNVQQLKRMDLISIALTFNKTWQDQFSSMIKLLWRLYINDFQKPVSYSFYIRSLDIISATFDVHYYDKRIYRFRYSPFQFRAFPFYKRDNQLTGYYQLLSCIPDVNPNTRASLTDSDFYTHHRLFIFDDLTDENIFTKLLNRGNLFYQMYSISKANVPYYQTPNDVDDFLKKCVGQFYFSTTRLKKFIFSWPLKPYRKGQRHKKAREEHIQSREIRELRELKEIRESKQVVLHLSFVLQRHNNNQPVAEPVYKIKIYMLEMNKFITFAIKQDLSYRIKQWYLLYKDLMPGKQKVAFEQQKAKLIKRSQKEYIFEDFQIPIQFNSKDRFDRFFIGLLLLVSTALDRHYFTLMEDKDRSRQVQKSIALYTSQTNYSSIKKQYISHIHSLKLIFKHTYFVQSFYSTSKQRQGLQYYIKTGGRYNDFRLKFGEWRLQRVLKLKRKVNIKEKGEIIDSQEAQLTTFPQDFKKYIAILLKHYPLRFIFKDILSFIESVCKICFTPQQDSNIINTNSYEPIVKSIINVLLSHFYYSQFNDRTSKQKEQQKQRVQVVQQKEIQEIHDKGRRQKIEESFSRVLFIKILTKEQIGFVQEEKLLFEITFKLMECKSVWHTRIKEGYIVLRIFEDRMDFEKDYNFVSSIKGDIRNKKIFDESIIKANILGCFNEPKQIITL